MEGVPSFVIYDAGADSDSNASRRISVRAATIHTTQGIDSRGLGKTRHHNTPGTFNFLIRLDGTVYCYYPAWVRCSHAGGANRSGPGIELEGYTDDVPQPAAQLQALGRLARWLNDNYKVPLSLYDPAKPDIAVDGSNFRGFVNHLNVATEPQWRHTDRITLGEWATALGSARPTPRGEDSMKVVVNTDTQEGVLLQDGAIVKTLGKRGAYGLFADQLSTSYALIYGVVELTQAQYQVLPLAAANPVVTLLRKMFPNRAERA